MPLKTLDRRIKIAVFLIAGLAAVLVLAISLGSERLAFFDLSDQQRTILFDIRIPRVLLGACVGAALAVSGAALQSLLRNPLAEPICWACRTVRRSAQCWLSCSLNNSNGRGHCSRLPERLSQHSRSIRWQKAGRR